MKVEHSSILALYIHISNYIILYTCPHSSFESHLKLIPGLWACILMNGRTFSNFCNLYNSVFSLTVGIQIFSWFFLFLILITHKLMGIHTIHKKKYIFLDSYKSFRKRINKYNNFRFSSIQISGLCRGCTATSSSRPGRKTGNSHFQTSGHYPLFFFFFF